MKEIIVISAHPDDETLGCGGTLLKHASKGDNIHWLILTNLSERAGYPKKRVDERQEEISSVAKAFNMRSVHKLDHPPSSLDGSKLNDLIEKISAVFQSVKPNVVYVMNRSDAHSDHRVAFDAVMACSKSFRYPSINTILMYECISETEFAPALPEKAFVPNYFVNISEFFSKKLETMKIYGSELGEHPFPRSIRNIEALAVFRGASCGVEYAEAFQLIKQIEK